MGALLVQTHTNKQNTFFFFQNDFSNQFSRLLGIFLKNYYFNYLSLEEIVRKLKTTTANANTQTNANVLMCFNFDRLMGLIPFLRLN